MNNIALQLIVTTPVKTQANTNVPLTLDVNSNFMQKIFNDENTVQEPKNILKALQSHQNEAVHNPEKIHEFLLINQVLTKYQPINITQAQTFDSQSESTNRASQPAPEQSVIYLLNWLASGHLSYVISDINSTNTEKIKHLEVSTSNIDNNSYKDLQNEKNINQNLSFDNKYIGSVDNNQKNNRTEHYEPDSSRVGAAISLLTEQVSLYLKRRLIISPQQDHIQIIVRDYFLGTEENQSDLKSLLTNIKQHISGNIKLTINGHHYGDINSYRQ